MEATSGAAAGHTTRFAKSGEMMMPRRHAKKRGALLGRGRWSGALALFAAQHALAVMALLAAIPVVVTAGALADLW